MNTYEKWGRSFIDSLFRHVGTSMACYTATEIKYQEINLHDFGMFLFVGAVVPTLIEFFKQGLPPEDSVEIVIAHENKAVDHPVTPPHP